MMSSSIVTFQRFSLDESYHIFLSDTLSDSGLPNIYPIGSLSKISGSNRVKNVWLGPLLRAQNLRLNRAGFKSRACRQATYTERLVFAWIDQTLDNQISRFMTKQTSQSHQPKVPSKSINKFICPHPNKSLINPTERVS